MTILPAEKKKREGTCSLPASHKQRSLCQVSAAAAERFRPPAGVTDSLSSRHVGPPHLPGLAVFIDSAIFLPRLPVRKSDTPVKDLWRSRERKGKQRVREKWRWSAGALHPTLPPPPAPLRTGSSPAVICLVPLWRNSRLDSSRSSSSAPAQARLPPWHRLLLLSSSRILDWTLLLSHSRASCPPPPAPVLTHLCSSTSSSALVSAKVQGLQFFPPPWR